MIEFIRKGPDGYVRAFTLRQSIKYKKEADISDESSVVWMFYPEKGYSKSYVLFSIDKTMNL